MITHSFLQNKITSNKLFLSTHNHASLNIIAFRIFFFFFWKKILFQFTKADSQSYVSVAITNYPDKIHLKKDQLIFAYKIILLLPFHSIIHHGRKFTAKEAYSAGHTVFAVRKQKVMYDLMTVFSPFIM